MTRPLRTLYATADRPASAYQTEQLLLEIIRRHEADLDRARREAMRAATSLRLARKALADLGKHDQQKSFVPYKYPLDSR